MQGRRGETELACRRAEGSKTSVLASVVTAVKKLRQVIMFSGKGFHYNRTLTILCNVCMLSHVRLFVTPWTVAHQAPLSMGFSRQEYWSGLPFPSPGVLSDSGIEPTSPALVGEFFTTAPPGKTQ